MCGRYATTRGVPDLSALFEATDDAGMLSPAYNVAPTDPVPIVRRSGRPGGRVLGVARWGLVPAWARDARSGARMINARAETVAASNAFGPSFARRRCLIPADGWYEWSRTGPKRKQAYYLTPRDGGILAFAGLWATWGDGDQRLMTCSIITTTALGRLARVHDRMPLALPASRWAHWLSGAAEPGALLAPPPDELVAGIEIRPVGTAVGDVRNDGPELIERVEVDRSGSGDGEPVHLTLF